MSTTVRPSATCCAPRTAAGRGGRRTEINDLLTDLRGEMSRLAEHLEIELTPQRAADLAEEASLARARDRARDVAPEAHLDVWKDPAAFFRSGSSGEWRDRMTVDQQHRYDGLITELTPPDLAYWIHHGCLG